MRRNAKVLKVLGITTAIFLVASTPTYSYAKTVIGNNLLTTTVAAKKAITWESKAIFKKTVKVKKKLTVLGATVLNTLSVSGLSTLNDVNVTGDLSLANGLGLGSLTGLTAGQIVMGNVEGTPTATALTGDVTVDSSGVTTLAADAVDVTGVASSTSDDGTVTDGVIKYRVISSDALISVLNGESNTLTTFDTGEIVLDVIITTEAASGLVSTVDIGTDANWGSSPSDANAFISAHDLNTSGSTRMTTQDVVNQSSAVNGDATKGDGSVVTIESSVAVNATDFLGNIIILYY